MLLVTLFALPHIFIHIYVVSLGYLYAAANNLLCYMLFRMPEVEIFVLRGRRLREAHSHP